MSKHYYGPLKIKTTKKAITEETHTPMLIETPPEVVGEGTYGCVHRPSLRCENKEDIDYSGKISKLGKKRHINEEIAEYDTIANIDKTNFFYTGKPDSCRPMRDPPTLAAIDKCRDFKAKKIAKYKLLVMKDGGENLEDYVNSFLSRRMETPMARNKIEKFWIEAQRMFLGVVRFLDAGIVHHDLKHKNIVYNESQNRINFIDFGLMTKANIIEDESRKSKYGFSIRHWSFPPELYFIDYKKYIKFAKTDATIPKNPKGSTIQPKKTPRQKAFAEFLNELKDPKSNLNTFFAITDPYFAEQKSESFTIQKHTSEYYRMVMNVLQKSNYSEFLKKSISTIDSYGLAISFMFVLNKTRHLLDEPTANDLYNLFYDMLNFNVMERVGAADALSRYEDILQNRGILAKYNVSFENHELKTNAAAVTTQVKQSLGKIQIPDIKVTEEHLESDPKTRCPDGTGYDKKKKRCIESTSTRSKTKKIRISKKRRVIIKQPKEFSANL